jgi:L-aspartate oxidase
VIDLITSAKLGAVAEDRVLGAYVLERKPARWVFRSDRVILAAGGCGKVYLYTTNPDSATGDGVALGWRAGATIANMEFIQFHPTCFYNPGATGPEARSFLVSEAVRGEGGILINAKGEDFTKKSTRAARSHRATSWRGRSTARSSAPARLRLSGRDPQAEGLHARALSLHLRDLLKFGLDCETQPIPVVPRPTTSAAGC